MVETRGSRRFAILFFVGAFLVLLLGRWVTPINHAALAVAAPFAAVFSTVANGTGDTVSGIFQGPRLRDENQRLRSEIAVLLHRNMTMQEAQHENDILRRMLRFDNANNSTDFLTARVIAWDPNSLSPSVVIDRGSRDGLKSGMTVVSDHGFFVGSITDMTANAAKVLLLDSPSSSVGALDMRTRVIGVVEGQYSGPPQLRMVPTSSRLRVGDFLVTSGQAGLFPRTLVIGQITSIKHRNDNPLQTANIQPAADLQNLEMVQVIRSFKPSTPLQLLKTP